MKVVIDTNVLVSAAIRDRDPDPDPEKVILYAASEPAGSRLELMYGRKE
jgi:predicted nucleic acid-binding protein